MRLALTLIILVSYSCSRTQNRDTVEELEDRLLKDERINKAPVTDTFLEEEAYVGPLNDQLNPFEQQETVEDLFSGQKIKHDKTAYKQEFDSIDSIAENEKTFENIKDGKYDKESVGPYEQILTVEKLALDEERGMPVDNYENILEHDWQEGKEELSKILDVAPLTEEELRDFLQKGRIKRKPELALTEKSLLRAAYNGPLESVKYLLSRGLSIESKNNKGDTALIIATRRNRFEVALFLLKAGADKDARNDKGESAERLARKSKDPRFAKLFE